MIDYLKFKESIMNAPFQPVALIEASDLSINRVLKNTYLLLGMTMLFSAITALFSMSINANPNPLIFIVGWFGLLFLTTRLQDSVWGVVAVLLLQVLLVIFWAPF
jgi:FtsH-binding integral membrane protein